MHQTFNQRDRFGDVLGVSELIHSPTCAFMPRTVRAAVKGAVRLNTVTKNLTATVIADRSQLVNRALKTVEDVGDTRCYDFKR